MNDSRASDTTTHQRILEWLRAKGADGLVILNIPYVYFASAARVIARDLGGMSTEAAQEALHALDGNGLLEFSLHRTRGTRILLRAVDNGLGAAEAVAGITADPAEVHLERLVTELQALCEHVRAAQPASARAIVRMTEQTIAELRTRPTDFARIGALLTGIGFGAAAIPGIRFAWDRATTAAGAFGLHLSLYEMPHTTE
jgi:hypothetical protein